MARLELPTPQGSVNEAGLIKRGLQNIEGDSIAKKLDATAASIRRNTLAPRAAQVHAFAPFPSQVLEEIVEGGRTTTEQPLLPVEAGFYLNLEGKLRYYPRKIENQEQHLE